MNNTCDLDALDQDSFDRDASDDGSDPAAEMTEEEWVAIHGQPDPYRFMTPEQFRAAMDATEDDETETEQEAA